MRSLRSTVAVGGMALLVLSGAGCGNIAKKGLEQGIKSATHGSVDINGKKVTIRDSNGNTCTANVGDTTTGTCVDSNGDTVASGKIDSNGATGVITDSNGASCSGSVGSDTGSGKCVDSNGKTIVSGNANSDSGNLTVNDSNGSSSFAAGSQKLPSGWPSELTPPSGVKINLTIDSGGKKAVSYNTTDSAAKVATFWGNKLSDAGFTKQGGVNNTSLTEVSYKRGGTTVTVEAIGEGGSTNVEAVETSS
jgi:hypothetical protein